MASELAITRGAEFVHVAPSGRESSAHALPLHKLVVPLDGAMLVCKHGRARIATRSPVLVAAGQLQSTSCSGPSIALFIAPFTPRGGCGRVQTELRTLAGRDADCAVSIARQLFERCTAEALSEATGQLRAQLLEHARLDARVARVLDLLAEPGDSVRPAIAALARAQRLSSSRLAHLVARDTGSSLRAFISYRRALAAAHRLAAGEPAARAAAASGYADQAHLCRALRRHFGRTPTAIASTNVQAGPP